MIRFASTDDIDLNVVYKRTTTGEFYTIVKNVENGRTVYRWNKFPDNILLGEVMLHWTYQTFYISKENNKSNDAFLKKFRSEWGMTPNRIFK